MSHDRPRSTAEARRLLGVSATAGEREVLAAYRRLARRLHPDAGGDPQAFATLTAARDLLLAASRPATRVDARHVTDPARRLTVRRRRGRRLLRAIRRGVVRKPRVRRSLQ
ncbi:DnaJ domain-containing protein [Egicoccus sp. AB-alg2]|uniref:DnaJ domain-containing protein n=1 Tax=Egicoccus sp. AB-alg2 TaxID=3242693 RepID=UPI00359EFDEE